MSLKESVNIMSKKPKDGFKFIYRYYDSDGSYIGQTSKSLKQRAGKDGKNYILSQSKWSEAILQKGFSKFNVEILEECPECDADKKEKSILKNMILIKMDIILQSVEKFTMDI